MRFFSIAIVVVAIPSIAGGQTVQLPVFNTTTASTTVNIPDRGGVLIGSVKRSAEGANEFGVPLLSNVPGANRLFRNKGIGRNTSDTTLSAHAYIMNFDEMEEDIMRQAAASRAAKGLRPLEEVIADEERAAKIWQAMKENGVPVSQPSYVEKSPPSLPDAEQIALQNLLKQQQRQSEAQQYFEKAKELARSGKRKLANHYLQLAARRAEGELKEEVLSAIQRYNSQ